MKYIPLLLAALALSACVSSQNSDGFANPAPKTEAPIGAYMIVMGKNYNAVDLSRYAAQLPPIYKKFGGKYIAFETDYDVLEGEVDYQSVIMSTWPSMDAAREFWNSPEYVNAKALRDGIADFKIVLLPAL